MVKFNFNEIDWEKYVYPGFEEGDILRDLVTRMQTRCRQVATCGELGLNEEDVPEYYKFICIDNPMGFGGTIWTNPELYELSQKRAANYKEQKKNPYFLRDPEREQQELEELQQAQQNQGIQVGGNNNFRWEMRGDEPQRVQVVPPIPQPVPAQDIPQGVRASGIDGPYRSEHGDVVRHTPNEVIFDRFGRRYLRDNEGIYRRQDAPVEEPVFDDNIDDMLANPVRLEDAVEAAPIIRNAPWLNPEEQAEILEIQRAQIAQRQAENARRAEDLRQAAQQAAQRNIDRRPI